MRSWGSTELPTWNERGRAAGWGRACRRIRFDFAPGNKDRAGVMENLEITRLDETVGPAKVPAEEGGKISGLEGGGGGCERVAVYGWEHGGWVWQDVYSSCANDR